MASPKSSNRLGRSLIAAGFGPLASQAFAIALLPLLFRYYVPADFGIWAAIQAAAVVAGSLLSFRFDLGLVIERDSAVASDLFFAILSIVCTMALVLGFLLVLSMGYLREFGVGPLYAALGWSWLALVGLGVACQSWLMREGAFAQISTGAVANAIVANLVQLAGALSGDGVWLVIGSVVGQAATTLFYARSVRRSAEAPMRPANTRAMIAALASNRRFLQFSLPFTVLSLLRERAPIFIAGAFGTAAQVGLYSQAWRLTHLPSAFTSAALRPVFFHRAATEGLAAQGPAIDRIMRWLLVVSSPWMALLVFGGDTLFAIVLGPRWQGVGGLSAILVLPASLFMMTNWMDRLLDSIGRQDVNLKLEAVAAISSVGCLWAALASGRSLPEAVALQSVALTLSYLAVLWICYGAAGWPAVRLLQSFGIAGALGATVFAVLAVMSRFLEPVATIALGVLLAVVISAVALLMARRELR